MPAPDVRSCGAVLYRDGPTGPLYLLLRHEAGHWDHPKGHVEPGEDETATARREIAEETGLDDITFVPGFRQVIRYHYRWGGRLVDKEVVFLLARTATEAVRLSAEHDEHAWLPYAEARARLTHADAKEVLRAAHERDDEPLR